MVEETLKLPSARSAGKRAREKLRAGVKKLVSGPWTGFYISSNESLDEACDKKQPMVWQQLLKSL
jgi:hypothetical protein